MTLPADLQPKPSRDWSVAEIEALSPAELEQYQDEITTQAPAIAERRRAAKHAAKVAQFADPAVVALLDDEARRKYADLIDEAQGPKPMTIAEYAAGRIARGLDGLD